MDGCVGEAVRWGRTGVRIRAAQRKQAGLEVDTVVGRVSCPEAVCLSLQNDLAVCYELD
jgi:hypothetical protein